MIGTMANLIKHNYGAIYDALHKMIIAEVKTALSLVPEKMIESKRINPLCHMVASDGDNYSPKDFAVYKVWLDEGVLRFCGRIEECDDDFSISEEHDILNLTDFDYLMTQIAALLPDGKDYNIINRSLAMQGFDSELALRMAIRKTY